MPLISQQDVVTVTAANLDLARAALLARLNAYPEVRIVSVSVSVLASINIVLVAVVETV